MQSLEEKNLRLQTHNDKVESIQSHSNEFMEELKTENSKLKNDVTWLANSARNNKIQSEKAIKDLEEYAEVLKLME